MRFNKIPVTKNDGTTQNYTIDTYFTTSSILLILLLFVSYIVYTDGFNANKYFYVECKNPMGLYCENPMYNNYNYCGKIVDANSQICSQELLTSGESIGVKPPSLLKYAPPLIIIYVIIIFLINHFLYNKNFSFKKVEWDI